MAPAKVDLKQELRQFYRPSGRAIGVVDVPAINFLMVDGAGDPNTAQAYKDAIEALFSVAYTLKFARRKAGKGPDFAVMPLETLWWSDDMGDFIRGDKSRWKWTAMMALPDFATAKDVAEAKRQAAAKKELAALAALRLERFREGPAAQILYTGPFADEGPTIEAIHRFITDSGKTLSGRHHEIYLSDFRRTAPEKLKTIIRQPFA